MISHGDVYGRRGIRLHRAFSGERGRLMLFLHGFPECWAAWDAQLREFGRDHRAVALDLRGYNLSDKPPDEAAYTLPCLVDDVRDIIVSLSGNEPAILVGHDWGGIIGWVLAFESPELLERLIIINAPHPSLFYRELKHNPRQQLASSYAGFFQFRGIAELALRACNFRLLRSLILGTSVEPETFSPEIRQIYLRAWREPGALTSALNYYRNLRVFRSVAKRLESRPVTVPTLVLWGEKDVSVLTDNLRGLGERVDRLAVERHPQASHWIVREKPAWVNARIRAFLQTGTAS